MPWEVLKIYNRNDKTFARIFNNITKAEELEEMEKKGECELCQLVEVKDLKNYGINYILE